MLLYASSDEDTEDAYFTGYTQQISSRITGTVEEVLADDNWHVTAGQPLLKLDPLLIQPNEPSNVQDFVRISSLFGNS